MWRGTRVDVTWHTRPRGSATWTHPSPCVALMWRGCMAGPREPTEMPRWHLRGMRVFRLESDGPTGIVGSGKIIGEVTHLRKEAPPFILAYSVYFLRVGLCSLLIFSL